MSHVPLVRARRSRRPRSRLALNGAVAAVAVVAALLPIAPVAAQDASPSAGVSPSASPSASASPGASASSTPSASPTVRLTTSVTQVLAGTSVTLTGRITDLAGRPVEGERFDVVSRTGGTTARVLIGRITSDAEGVAVLDWAPRTSSEYFLRSSSASSRAIESDRRTVHVQPRLTGTLNPTSVVTGSATTLAGTLAPAYFGSRLQVQRRLPDNSWQAVAVIATNGVGAYRFSVAPSALGRHVYRVLLPGTQAHRLASSPPVAVNVLADPTLRSGDRGQAVRTLEQRLLAQRVDIGNVDGVFDYDLRHGLVAFQKSQGLPRTGQYDLRTRQRLARPLPVRLRFPSAGRALEVDLTKQVLYLSQGGVLQRIVDISSGNDKPYTVNGVTSRATTPTGRFRIERKIDGVRVSRLGKLYRPAYFVRGWAVHGSPSVPNYPASHGCIRTTNGSMDRMFALLTVGTPIAVFRS